MSSKSTILVVGATGTIGEPLTAFFASLRDQLGIGSVIGHKNKPELKDRPRVHALQRAGVRIAVDDKKLAEFRSVGIYPDISRTEALREAAVVIDCTPKGFGLANKRSFYEELNDGTRSFIAQGSEFGFGLPYAYGINDAALQKEKDPFVQVVSCNTHALAVILQSVVLDANPEDLVRARFEFMRRSSDISQDEVVSAPTVSDHVDARFGTHHARDGFYLFRTNGLELDLFSSAVKLPTQFLHTAKFKIRVRGVVDEQTVLNRLQSNPRIALTGWSSTNRIFAFGRDHGFHGRILNNAVVVPSSLHIEDLDDCSEIRGFLMVPQDGNSLVSSIAAVLRHLFPDTYIKMMGMFDEPPYSFTEV